MTNKERGEFIVKFFTELKEEVTAIGGELNQAASRVDEHPQCGSVACVAGWIAHKAKTEVYGGFILERHRKFSEGIVWLSERLEIVGVDICNWVHSTKLWHNENGDLVFGGADYAYNGDGTTTAQQAFDYWIAYGKRLMA